MASSFSGVAKRVLPASSVVIVTYRSRKTQDDVSTGEAGFVSAEFESARLTK
jgi:hypothetical protein